MNITGLQWNLAWEDRDANYSRVRELLSDAGTTDLLILPEMFSSGFSMNVAATAEPDDLPTEAFLRELAGNHSAAALGGLVRPGEEKCHNELIAFSPDGVELGRYRKNRTFRYTNESDFYENGTDITVFEWQDWKIAPLICYDLRFPELFRRATAKGAELIVVIASWPSVRVDHWVTLLRARAIENLAYVVGVNRTGQDPNLEYPGRSIVVDPRGEIVADGGADDGLIEAEIDLEKVRGWRSEFPALLDLES
ncbi:MAG: carbon-nitrogen family hydrolase [Verrucomicrobiales bacterium]|nr:carbon-nitrogen family hydrolase [Verrucomicrobiales bacterium]